MIGPLRLVLPLAALLAMALCATALAAGPEAETNECANLSG